jgi:hypothetical protein
VQVGTLVEASAEDQLEVDNKKEQERLKVLGIERAKVGTACCGGPF